MASNRGERDSGEPEKELSVRSMDGIREPAPPEEAAGEEMVKKTVRLPAREAGLLRETASREGVSESEVVRKAVRLYLEITS